MRYVWIEDDQQGSIENAFEDWQENSGEEALSKWAQVCKLALERMKSSSISGISTLLKSVFVMSLSVPGDVGQEIFFKAFEKWKPFAGGLVPDDYRILAKAIVRFGWGSVYPKMDEIFVGDGPLDRFQEALEAVCEKLRAQFPELDDAQKNENILPSLNAIDTWANSRLLLETEKTDITTAPNLAALKTVLERIPERSLRKFYEVVAKSVENKPMIFSHAYDLFVIASQKFTTVAGKAFDSFLNALQTSKELTTTSFSAYIENLGLISIPLLNVLVLEILSSPNMHMRDGIASRWIAFLPELVQVAIRRPELFDQISNLIPMILATYLVLDVDPEIQPDTSFPEKTVDCTCQYCTTINYFLGNPYQTDFNGSSLRWSREVCDHVNIMRRGQPRIQPKTNMQFLQQATNPHFRIRKIDKDFNAAVQARIDRKRRYDMILQAISTIVSQRYPPWRLLGSLTQSLQYQDERICTKFLQAAVDESLSQTLFELSPEIDVEHRQRIENIVKARDGKIDNGVHSENNGNVICSGKKILISKIEQDIDGMGRACAKYGSTSESVEIQVCHFQKFVDNFWSNSLIERFHPPIAQPAIGLKRKAFELERQPLMDEPNLTVPADVEHRVKIPCLTGSPVDRADKENMPDEESLEVVDLT